MSQNGDFSSTLNALISGNAQPQPSLQPIATAVSLPPEAKPYAKGAGFHVPPGSANGPILLDDCQAIEATMERSAAETGSSPASAAAGKSEAGKSEVRDQRSEVKVVRHGEPPPAALPPLTLRALVKEWRIDQQKGTHRALRLGDLADAWIRWQPDRPAEEQLDRASALKMIRRALLAGGIDARSCRVDRYVRCHHVARLLAADYAKAALISISAIRELQPLIERYAGPDAKEQWRLVPAHAEQARGLWARMFGEHLSAEAVRAAVDKILHPEPLPLEQQRKRTVMPRLHRTVQGLSIEQLKQARRWINEELLKSLPKPSPTAA